MTMPESKQQHGVVVATCSDIASAHDEKAERPRRPGRRTCIPVTGSVPDRGRRPLRYRRRMPGFDLHTHSTFSDGTLDPEQVVELAATRDLTGIALTDHDNTGGVERAQAAARGTGLTVLLGCELSAEHDGNPVQALGYGFAPG